MKYHGYQLATEETTGRFHLALVKLFKEIDYQYFFQLGKNDQPPNWPEKWFDKKFRSAVLKFSDTFGKLDTVSHIIAKEKENIFKLSKSESLESTLRMKWAFETIPIHLDSILFYLRILADNLSDLTPYLYPVSKGKQIGNRSFRSLRKWFLEHHDLDPEFSEIMQNQTEWFNTLAGKSEDEGLRDKVIHHRGTFQLIYSLTSIPEEFDLKAGMVGDSGWIFNDIFPELVKAVEKMFEFMDSYTVHFNKRIESIIGIPLLDLQNPVRTELYRFRNAMPSFWLFPKIKI